jgi:ectoine hydroxylase-related dioxygenase (phytanoyl-CoA dioxygenase family)
MYWGLGEGARVVSAWIAIDDSSPDNGCMRAVRRAPPSTLHPGCPSRAML